ncbi:MAG: ion channel [Peptococcaceae bacterium]|nr:ion channel [Peptococcaceae bacterium]
MDQLPFFMLLLWSKIKRHQTVTLTLSALCTTLLGAGLFAWTQHVSPFTGLYWAVTTVTTVGYGDVTPHNSLGRLIAMGTMLTTIPLAGAAFAGWAAATASLHVRRFLGMTLDKIRDHLVILGYTPLLTYLIPDLLAEHQSVILVADVDSADLPPGVPYITGDPTNPHVLAKAHLAHARQVVIVGTTDGDVLMTAVEVQHLAPAVPIFALTQSCRAVQALRDLGIKHTVATQDLLSHTIAKSLETPHAADLLATLLTSEYTTLREIPVPPEWIGQPLGAVRHQASGLLLGIVQQGQVLLGVHKDPIVSPGDTALFVAPQKKETGISPNRID